MSNITRKIERNVLKKEQGNNKIKEEWQKYMNYKYSYGELVELHRKNKKRK